MRERGGKTNAMPIPSTDKATIEAAIYDHVEAGSMIHTDEAGVIPALTRRSTNTLRSTMGAGEYVRDDVTTNGVESVFAVMKRGIYGVYHHVSAKHLHHYIDEFTSRLNEGNVARHTLTYKALIA